MVTRNHDLVSVERSYTLKLRSLEPNMKVYCVTNVKMDTVTPGQAVAGSSGV